MPSESTAPEDMRRDVIRATCGWFKPLWYRAAEQRGYIAPATLVDDGSLVLTTVAPRPNDWINNVQKFLAAGLPVDLIEIAVHAAMDAPIPHDARWRYFIGQCTHELREIRILADQILKGGDA